MPSFKPSSASQVAIDIDLASGQTAPAIQVRDSTGTDVFVVGKAGGTTLPTTPTGIPNWHPVAATSGTDSACTNGTSYFSSFWLPVNKTLTGLAYLIGSVGGTDKVITTLYSSTGALLANSALAGATVGTAANIQAVAFTSTYEAVAGRYFAGVTFNGTTAKFRTVPAHTQAGIFSGSEAETFGTATAITAPTTFTADVAPVSFLY